MNLIKNMEVGKMFSNGKINAIPYNHWEKDFDWVVFLMEEDSTGAFVHVYALTPEEACHIAIHQFAINQKEEENDI